MSSDGQFDVDPSVLESEGYSFSTAGQEFSQAVTRLRNGLTALEGTGTPPWGDDDLGEKFGVVYTGFRDGMYESMDSLAQRTAGMGTALTHMGVTYQEADTSTSDLMKDRDSDLRTDESGSRFLSTGG